MFYRGQSSKIIGFPSNNGRPVNLWERPPWIFLKIILENPVDFFAAIKSDINAQKSDIDTQKNIANEKVSYKTVYPHFRF